MALSVLQPVLDFFGRKVVKQVKQEETTVKTEGDAVFVYL